MRVPDARLFVSLTVLGLWSSTACYPGPTSEVVGDWVLTREPDWVSDQTILSIETQAIYSSVGTAYLGMYCEDHHRRLVAPYIWWVGDDIGTRSFISKRGKYQIGDVEGNDYWRVGDRIPTAGSRRLSLDFDDDEDAHLAYAGDVSIFDDMVDREDELLTVYVEDIYGRESVLVFSLKGLTDALDEFPCKRDGRKDTRELPVDTVMIGVFAVIIIVIGCYLWTRTTRRKHK